MNTFALSFCAAAAAAPVAFAGIVEFASRAEYVARFGNDVFESWDDNPAFQPIPNGSTVDGITYSTSRGTAEVERFNFATGDNQLTLTAPGTRGFLEGDSLTLTFETALTAFALDINQSLNAPVGAITVELDTGDVANSVPEALPGQSFGHFVGFESDTAFRSVTITNTYAFQAAAFNDLRAVFVPAPGAATVAVAGGLVASRRRR